jgi:hypothetical protein
MKNHKIIFWYYLIYSTTNLSTASRKEFTFQNICYDTKLIHTDYTHSKIKSTPSLISPSSPWRVQGTYIFGNGQLLPYIFFERVINTSTTAPANQKRCRIYLWWTMWNIFSTNQDRSYQFQSACPLRSQLSACYSDRRITLRPRVCSVTRNARRLGTANCFFGSR